MNPRPQSMAWLATAFLVLAISAVANRANDGLWYQGDSPRHALNGVFYADALADGGYRHPRTYAYDYYRRFPAIAPTIWPPLFHLAEAAAFRAVGVSTAAARALVLAFAATYAVYLFLLLGQRRVRFAARWLAVLSLAQPALLVWANAVMLDVPALALGTASVYHLERARVEEGRRHLWWAALMGAACALTRLQGVFLPAAYLASTLATGKGRRLCRRDSVLIGIAALLLVAPWLVVQARFGGIVFAQAGPLGGSFLWADALLYYFRTLSANLHPGYAALLVAAIALGIASPGARRETLRHALALALLLAIYAAIGLKSPRFVIGILPLSALAIAVGLNDAGRYLATRRAAAVGLVAVVVALCAYHAGRTAAPRVSGLRAAAQDVLRRYPGDRLLYLGRYDGVFVFYARSEAEEPERVAVVRGSKVFYATALLESFGVEEFVRTPDDVVRIVGERAARLILLESEPATDLASERIVRETVRSDRRFRRVGSYPVETERLSRAVTSLEVYEFLGPLSDPPAEDFRFPALEVRPFAGSG